MYSSAVMMKHVIMPDDNEYGDLEDLDIQYYDHISLGDTT